MNGSIFHYTTADGLIGILTSQTLYATHPDFLNDGSECAAIGEFIVPIFGKEIEDLVSQLLARGLMSPAVHSEFGKSIYLREAEKFFKIILTTNNKLAPFFISSFCRHSPESAEYENGLLSQWRGYAGGSGFAIEFDEDELDALIHVDKDTHAYFGFRSDDVSYHEHEKHIEVERFTGLAKALMRDMYANKEIDISDLAGSRQIDEIFEPFVKIAPFLKNSSFEEEREYRIVAICYRNPIVAQEINKPLKKIKFLNRSGLITPYIELFEGLKKQLPIRSIIVGPHPRQREQRYSVEALLDSAGLSAAIRMSSTPFRGR